MTLAIFLLLFFVILFTFIGWVVHLETKQAIALKSSCEHTYELLERFDVKSAFGSIEAYKYVNKCTKCGELDVTKVNIQ